MDTNNTENKDVHVPESPSVVPSSELKTSATSSGSSVTPEVSVPETTPGPFAPAQPETKLATPSPMESGPKKKGMPVALIIGLLIVSFVAILLAMVWYFQGQLQKVNAPVNKQQSGVKPIPQVIVIGTDATAPPMESVNEQGGLVGYDIDLGYRIANEMGVKAEFRNIAWDDVFKMLETKQIDMIISSVTITDERKLKYNFSEPYINAGQVIVSRKDTPIKIVEELKGKKISVQTGTTNEKEAFKYTTAENVLSFAGFVDAAKALSEGKSDAMISDLTMAKGFISQYDNLKITSDPFTNDYYGVVMHKDNTELKKKVDEAVSALRVNGILTDLKQKWLE